MTHSGISPLPKDDEETLCTIASIDASPMVGANYCGYDPHNTYGGTNVEAKRLSKG